MGKLKLKPPIKSLQEAITCLNPVGPICIQEAKTHSFREESAAKLPTNVYYTPNTPSSSSSSSSLSLSSSSAMPSGQEASRRFFFSPHTTSSIMEEAKSEVSVFEESVRVAVASEDPYRDFTASMEEMVEAHEVREWGRLEELLGCYLRLNDRKTHRVIALAFMDLLDRILVVQEEDKDSPPP